VIHYIDGYSLQNKGMARLLEINGEAMAILSLHIGGLNRYIRVLNTFEGEGLKPRVFT